MGSFQKSELAVQKTGRDKYTYRHSDSDTFKHTPSENPSENEE